MGLYLIVQPSGHKAWAVRYRRPDGKPAKLTIGAVTDYTLATAREKAAAARNRVEQGVDPASRRQISEATADDSVASHVARFLAGYRRRRSTVEAAERAFNNVVIPAWRGRSIQDVRRRDVIDLIDTVATERGPHSASRLLAVLSKFFGWLLSRDVLTASPCVGVKRPECVTSRKRILSDAELSALLKAANTDRSSDRAIWLLALTGCRRNEVAGLT